MNILYCTDENYSEICLVSLTSLLEKNAHFDCIAIYIISDNLSADTIGRFEALVRQYGREVHIIDADDVKLPAANFQEFPRAAYCRLMISDLLPQCDKILYIDCDTIVVNSVDDLWNIDMGDNLFAGVKDPIDDFLAEAVQTTNSEYINSGVLLMNLVQLRKFEFVKKVYEMVDEYKGMVPHRDQGIINKIARQRIIFLKPRFNMMNGYYAFTATQLKRLYKISQLYDVDIEEERNNAVIVHFLSKYYDRPWFLACKHPLKNVFLSYHERMGCSLKRSNKNAKNLIGDYIYRSCPFFVVLFLERIVHAMRKKRFSKHAL